MQGVQVVLYEQEIIRNIAGRLETTETMQQSHNQPSLSVHMVPGQGELVDGGQQKHWGGCWGYWESP